MFGILTGGYKTSLGKAPVVEIRSLPKNVERRQWVNRNNRDKVVFNAAGIIPMPHSAKALRLEAICKSL